MPRRVIEERLVEDLSPPGTRQRCEVEVGSEYEPAVALKDVPSKIDGLVQIFEGGGRRTLFADMGDDFVRPGANSGRLGHQVVPVPTWLRRVDPEDAGLVLEVLQKGGERQALPDHQGAQADRLCRNIEIRVMAHPLPGGAGRTLPDRPGRIPPDLPVMEEYHSPWPQQTKLLFPGRRWLRHGSDDIPLTSPVPLAAVSCRRPDLPKRVGEGGFEPPTSCPQSRRAASCATPR